MYNIYIYYTHMLQRQILCTAIVPPWPSIQGQQFGETQLSHCINFRKHTLSSFVQVKNKSV